MQNATVCRLATSFPTPLTTSQPRDSVNEPPYDASRETDCEQDSPPPPLQHPSWRSVGGKWQLITPKTKAETPTTAARNPPAPAARNFQQSLQRASWNRNRARGAAPTTTALTPTRPAMVTVEAPVFSASATASDPATTPAPAIDTDDEDQRHQHSKHQHSKHQHSRHQHSRHQHSSLQHSSRRPQH